MREFRTYGSVRGVPRDRGVSTATPLSPQNPLECAARAVIAHVACDGVGLSGSDVAGLLGVSNASVSAARRRGRAALASLNLSVDDALAWPARGR